MIKLEKNLTLNETYIGIGFYLFILKTKKKNEEMLRFTIKICYVFLT